MAKYLSNRQKNLKVGIVSYTESNTVLEVTGKVGIGTTNAVGQLQVSSGPVIIGSATSTNTPTQRLQVTGGAYVSGNVGLGTTNPTRQLDVVGDVRIRGGIYDNVNNSAGQNSQVPVADGNGGWSWQPVSAAGAGTLQGITVRRNGSVVGSSGSITDLDFKGTNITVSSNVGGTISTITSSDTPTFDSLNVIGVSTLGIFEDEQKVTKNVTLGSNKNYYSVHKTLIVEGNSILTIGAGSTLTLDRFNNLDDVEAISLKVTSGPLLVGGLSTTHTPPDNSQMTFELTSNTNLRIKVRGSDGVLRSANITLS